VVLLIWHEHHDLASDFRRLREEAENLHPLCVLEPMLENTFVESDVETIFKGQTLERPLHNADPGNDLGIALRQAAEDLPCALQDTRRVIE